MRVLLVEDDARTTHDVSMMLRASGIVTDATARGEEALELAALYDYDIVLLNLMLPDMEGYDVLRRLRGARIETPVLVLSGLAGAQPRIQALATGADDVITKPFDQQELVARVQAIVRRARGFSKSVLLVGPLSLDISVQEARIHDQALHLTRKEYAILELMTLRKGQAVSKEAFLNHLYGGIDEPDAKIIDVFVCKLRKKLADAGASDLVSTIWGRGYLLRDVRAETPEMPWCSRVGLPMSRLAA
jgi:two-component system cell cycle response regulator CtrA